MTKPSSKDVDPIGSPVPLASPGCYLAMLLPEFFSFLLHQGNLLRSVVREDDGITMHGFCLLKDPLQLIFGASSPSLLDVVKVTEVPEVPLAVDAVAEALSRILCVIGMFSKSILQGIQYTVYRQLIGKTKTNERCPSRLASFSDPPSKMSPPGPRRPSFGSHKNTQATLSPCRPSTNPSQPALYIPGKETQQTKAPSMITPW